MHRPSRFAIAAVLGMALAGAGGLGSGPRNLLDLATTVGGLPYGNSGPGGSSRGPRGAHRRRGPAHTLGRRQHSLKSRSRRQRAAAKAKRARARA